MMNQWDLGAPDIETNAHVNCSYMAISKKIEKLNFAEIVVSRSFSPYVLGLVVDDDNGIDLVSN